MKASTYHPSLLELKNEVKQRSKTLLATKKGKQLSKKDNPSPGQWTMLKCQNWLESYAITDPSDVNFLRSEMQARQIIVTKAVEQKQSEEQKLLQYDDGNNWYGKDPILHLIHTLDETEIRHAYMDRHNLSNESIVLDNVKSVEKREMTVWQKMVNVLNDETFALLTMSLSPQQTTHFVDSKVISFDSDLSATTPEKCAHKFAAMTVELQRMSSRWTLSGKGDEDLDGYNAGEDEEDVFGSLTCCSQGALNSRASFLGTSEPYILYLWEYLNAHNLLKTLFQCLDPKVATKKWREGGSFHHSISTCNTFTFR